MSLRGSPNECRIYHVLTHLYQPWNFGEDPFSSSWDRFAPKSTIKNMKKRKKKHRQSIYPAGQAWKIDSSSSSSRAKNWSLFAEVVIRHRWECFLETRFSLAAILCAMLQYVTTNAHMKSRQLRHCGYATQVTADAAAAGAAVLLGDSVKSLCLSVQRCPLTTL